MKRRLVLALLLMSGIFVTNTVVLACPSCFGDVNSSEVQGTKWAIIALLGVTGTVLVGVSAFFLYLRKRALELNRRFRDRLN